MFRRALSSSLREAVIVSAVRTPIGCISGALSSFTATQLGALTIRAALEKCGLSKSEVDEVYMGNVVTAGEGQAPARQAAMFADLPNTVPASTINKVCASGMKAVMLAAQNIMTGQAECMVAGGMESMSNIPYYVKKARMGYRYGNGVFEDGILTDGLTDVYSQKHMGTFGDLCAEKYGITREDQDLFARTSYERAIDATKKGLFKQEVVPVSVIKKKGKPPVVVSEDEELGRVQFDKFATLRPAFGKKGTVTAANASSLNDGASSLIVVSREKAERSGLKPLARIVGFADAAHEPEWFTTAPQLATKKLLKRVGMSIKDIDLFEFNEAFSVVGIVNSRILDIDMAKVNVYGGAVAIGHPIGCSGARILTTLLHALIQEDKHIGLAAICNGGGGAGAMMIERLA
uniref:acetyl-CoA C-acetyltransferase n=1 Tax=Stygiella incarcerata TaxID=1712417 RepID=A0A192ZIR0_9EUKA|nr:acetyl-CoA C-acetyltransferase/acetyl-CoA thiolase [Stygiella incarcerata]